MNADELQSKVFSFLRFPLIVGVVFVHNYSFGGLSIDVQKVAPTAYACREFFSQVLARLSVPVFFFMSGYLFFHNVIFDGSVYFRKLRSRGKSLLIPYVFWNAAFLIVYYLASLMPSTAALINNTPNIDVDFILSSLWARPSADPNWTYPIAYQFWFIRDLMVIVVLSPLVYWAMKTTREYGLLAVAVCWMCGLSIPFFGVRGFDTSAWFFFMVGSFFSISRKNVVTVFAVFGNWVYLLYATLSLVDLFTDSGLIHKLGIVVGLICVVKLTACLIERQMIRINPFLTSASFFVFAVHEPFLLTMPYKLLHRVVALNTDMLLTVVYFAMVLFAVVAALGLYYVSKRLMPSFTAVITGGRC